MQTRSSAHSVDSFSCLRSTSGVDHIGRFKPVGVYVEVAKRYIELAPRNRFVENITRANDRKCQVFLKRI